MSEMGLVVVGAAGRMGQTLIRTIAAMPGARVAGAIERAGSPQLGTDAGELAGVGPLGVPITDDPLPVFAKADGVLDFTTPAATVEFAGYAAQARIVHVIGTTGCAAEDDAKIAAAARHATIVKSGNMSLGVNLLAVLVEQAAQGARPGGFRHRDPRNAPPHKVDAPSGTALLLGEAAARGPRHRACRPQRAGARRPHRRARRGAIGFATLRGGSVVGDHSVILAGAGERITLSHHAEDRAHLRARRGQGGALGARPASPASIRMRDVLGLGLTRRSQHRIADEGDTHVRNTRARPPRPERMEPEEPVHRLARRRPDRAGPCRRPRPPAQS